MINYPFIFRSVSFLMLLGVLSAANFAVADDQNTKSPATATSAGAIASGTTAAQPAKKDAVAETVSKFDLSKPATAVVFYGDVGVGCVAAVGHSHGPDLRNCPSGLYSQFDLGTDIKLNDKVSLGIQVQTLQFQGAR